MFKHTVCMQHEIKKKKEYKSIIDLYLTMYQFKTYIIAMSKVIAFNIPKLLKGTFFNFTFQRSKQRTITLIYSTSLLKAN